MVIYLGRLLPAASVQRTRRFNGTGRPYNACFALLPVRFASRPCHQRRWWSFTPPFHPYLAQWRGGLFSVALAVGLPRLAVSQHRALWSGDFPHPGEPGRDHLAYLDRSDYTR